jgi:hypothetical protein
MSNVLNDAIDIVNDESLDDLRKMISDTKRGHELKVLSDLKKSGYNTQPETHNQCIQKLHEIDFDASNIFMHMIIKDLWNALFYKAWLDYKKTYIVDTDFFISLTKAKSVKIYPSILKTLPFDTFAVDLSGSNIFNGYILCSYDVTDEGIYCSFLTSPYNDDENENLNNNFGIFLDAASMQKDENEKLYFDLDKTTEEATDISFFRNTDKLLTKVELDAKTDNGNVQETVKQYISDNFNDNEKCFLLKKALIQLAYYLCTPEPDVQETKETKKARKNPKKRKRGTVEYKYNIGSRIGARIRLEKTASRDIGETIEYTKGTAKCPHVRAAHWTHVWCGPKDNQHIEARFIAATFVNYSLANIDEGCNEVSDKVKQSWEGEELICRTLNALGIKYKRQAPIVVDNHRYKFDVEITVDGQSRYIEYDGEQHFRPVSIFGDQEGFNRTREADIIKNNHCYQNNIPLLRIPYKDKSNIDKLVRGFVSEAKVYQFTKDGENMYYSA